MAHPRKAKAYLTPKNQSLLIGYVSVEQISKSETINLALKAFFQLIDEAKRKKYIEAATLVDARKPK